MSRVFRADIYRMYRGRRFWLFSAAMFAVSVVFIVMQHTAMDYVVKLDRVLFLPMTFYGILTAALLSLFVGEDFSDGVIRNKIIAGRSRREIYRSGLLVCWTACVAVYILSLAATLGIGMHFFENNVDAETLGIYFLMGIFMCLAMGSIFYLLSVLIADKAAAVMSCMGLAFCMLILCLHTNQVMIHHPNIVYGMLHDINPMGQAAQLSMMKYLSLSRWIGCDVFWILTAWTLGNQFFEHKDIK